MLVDNDDMTMVIEIMVIIIMIKNERNQQDRRQPIEKKIIKTVSRCAKHTSGGDTKNLGRSIFIIIGTNIILYTDGSGTITYLSI
jgi:hypothetical protein